LPYRHKNAWTTVSWRRALFTVLIFLFIIHQTICSIGIRLGAGIAWPLFRYRTIYLGTSTIPVTRDMSYVAAGVLPGRTAFGILLWVLGVLFLSGSLIITVYDTIEKLDYHGVAGTAIIAAGLLFLASCMAQFGPNLSGPARVVIPVGIPLTVIGGWWMYR
jgi:hypothetical protein